MSHKLGIIGFGGMASGYHYGTAKREDIPDYDVVAVYDINPDRLADAASKGLKAYDKLEDFLDSHEFDLVLVSTSNNYHCEMTCKALKAGYNVICEKPVAMNSNELQIMINTAAETGKLFTVHQNRRWDKDFLIVKQAFEENIIGKPHMIESRIHSVAGGTMGGWRGYKDHGGGMLLDWGVHMLDQLLYLIPEPVKTVSAVIRRLKSDEVDDYTKIIMTFESGLAAQMEVATFALKPLPRWAVYGDEGAFTIDSINSPHAEVTHVKNAHWDAGESLVYVEHKVEKRPQNSYHTEFESFTYPQTPPPQDWASLYKNVLAALDGKEELIVKPCQVMRVMKVIEAAFRSSDEGITVKF